MKLIPLFVLPLLFAGCFSIHNGGGVDVDARYQHKVALSSVGVDDLVVDWENGCVELIADESKNIRIMAVGYHNGSLVAPEKWLKYARFEVEGGVVRLVFDYQGISNPFSVALRIHFPRSMALNINTSNGSVDMDGGSSAVVETSNGSIKVSGVGGELHLDTSNGSIIVTGSPGEIYANTSNGRINLEISGDHTGAITADSSNGKISLTMSGSQHDPVVLETSNASIELYTGLGFDADTIVDTSNGSIAIGMSYLPAGLAISASTCNGEVSSNLPGVSVSEDTLYRSGDGPTMTLDTSNGSISIVSTKPE